MVENSDKIRLFFAILLDGGAKNYAGNIQSVLWENTAAMPTRNWRWVNPVDTHLTLFFLGDQVENDIPSFIDVGHEAAAHLPEFSLHLNGLGQFPFTGTARVLWLGAREEKSNYLTSLATSLQTALKPFTADHKAFNPHVTLAYVRPAAAQKELSQAMAHSLGDPRVAEPYDMSVRQFALMASALAGELREPTESRYTLVHSFLLHNTLDLPVTDKNQDIPTTQEL